MGTKLFEKFGSIAPPKQTHGHKCPECKAPMIERYNRKTEEMFYGCSNYPDCTGTRNEAGESTSGEADPTEELDGHLRFSNDRS